MALVALAPACFTVTTPSMSDASGGTGSGGTGAMQAPPRCEQTCQDDDVAYAIDNSGWLLYNQDVAGQPAGNLTRTAPCPLSGTAAISGTINTASNGVTTTDLTFDLQNCGIAAASYTLTFTGSLRMSGTFTSNVQNDITWSSNSLAIAGQLKVLDDPSVNETCATSMTDTWNYDPNSTTWLNGLVCGRSAGSTGSTTSGSGGSGAGGSSSTGTGGTGQTASSSGVTTCGNCPGQLECSTLTGKCVVQSCACFYTVNGSDADSSWYLANGSCFMCGQNGLNTGDCTAAADSAAQAIVNCQ
jgi:hypothetical protein